MSDHAALDQLLTVSQLRYDHQRQAFAKILDKENRLRAELLRLAEMGSHTAEEADTLKPMRAIGADLLWQGWLGRTRTKLNIQLARTLALKEFEQRKVRQAFGKVTALQEIIQAQSKKERAERTRQALDRAIEATLTDQRENF